MGCGDDAGAQQPRLIADAASRLGPNQQVVAGPPRRGEQVVEVRLAGGHRDHRLGGRQGGFSGGQAVQPALAFLVRGRLAVALAAFAEVLAGAGQNVLVKQVQGDALGADRQNGVDEQAALGQIAEMAQVLGGGVVGVVQQGGVLNGQDGLAVGGQTVAGAAGVRGDNVVGVHGGVVPEAVGGLGSRPGAAGDGDRLFGVGGQVGDEADEALVASLVAEFGVAVFAGGPRIVRSMFHTRIRCATRPEGSGIVGNA